MRTLTVVLLTQLFIFQNSFPQILTVESVSFHEKLKVNQAYMNNAPSGFEEFVACPDSLTFCVISGRFSDNISVAPDEISLVTKDKKTYYPVGMVNEKGLPELTFLGIQADFQKNNSPIFAIPKKVVPVFVLVKNEKIPLMTPASSKVFEITKLPDLKFITANFAAEVEMNISLLPSNIKFGSGHEMKGFKQYYKPVRGKILCVEISIGDSPSNIDMKEFSIYSDNGYQGYAIAKKDWAGLSTFGKVNEGEVILFFVVSEDFKKGEIRFDHKMISTFLVGNK